MHKRTAIRELQIQSNVVFVLFVIALLFQIYGIFV